MKYRTRILALCIMFTGLAQAQEELPDFWELPYPEFSEIVPALCQAAQINNVSEDALAFFVELRNDSTQKQWVVEVNESDNESPQEPQTESILYHCSTGDEFEFQSTLKSLKLVTLGPVIFKKGKLSRKSKAEERVEGDVVVMRDFLLLGFDKLAEFTLKIFSGERPKNGLHIEPGPLEPDSFPPELISETKAEFEAFGIGSDQIRSIAGLAPSLSSFFNLLRSTPGVKDILMEIVDRPSILSLLSKGLEVNFNFRGEGVASENPISWGLNEDISCYRFPITLKLNGKDGLNVILIVRSPEGPYAMTAGVVGVIAYRPEDTSRVLMIHLLDRSNPETTPAVD